MRSVLWPADMQPAVALLAVRARSRGMPDAQGASASVTMTDNALQSEQKPHLSRSLSWEATMMDKSEDGQVGCMCAAAASCCLLWRSHHSMQQARGMGSAQIGSEPALQECGCQMCR